MPSLHELQRTFAESMLTERAADVFDAIHDDGISAAERLRIYRNTFRSTLTRTLRMVYRAVDRLVGAEFFDTAVEMFIAERPPDSGDLNEYGALFPDFLAAFPPASGLPYLSDVARFEWALNAAANAADADTLDARDLAAVEPWRHALLRFASHPSVNLLVLAYPADHIADAVLSGDDAAMAQIDLSSEPVQLVVHRGARGIEAQRVDPEAYDFLSRLYAGEALGALLEDTSSNVPALLAQEITQGRLSALAPVRIDGRHTDEQRRQ